MRPLEEIAAEGRKQVEALLPGAPFTTLGAEKVEAIILSALTEAEQVALKTAIQENESLHQSLIASETQVAELREALEKIGNAPDTGDHPFLAGGIARAALSPKP